VAANINPRQQALAVLQKVVGKGESLSSALPAMDARLAAQDRAFIQMLVYGVCRWYWRLDALLRPLMKKPLKAKDSDVQLLLMLALYQLLDTRVPDYASVDAAVKLVPRKKAWAVGLVNGVLRNFLRQREQLEQQLADDPQGYYAHPRWLIEGLQQDWPEHWQPILEANNRQAPMVLRINRQKISVEHYQAQLVQAASILGDSGLVLEQACEVSQLPGYTEGWFSVQDAGAQQAAPLLDLQPGLRVLDACAAPGGKTCHMLELQPDLHMLALDVSEPRLQRVRENLDRLGLDAELRCADAAEPDAWWDGQPFDRVLLDVPCSATGVIRRHPDIKLLRRADDIPRLMTLQQQMLRQAWRLLAPGGLLLYATCSVFKGENEQQLAEFLCDTPDAKDIIIQAEWGSACSHGRQILPGQDGMDGFYYALLQKNP
jgi:16S rRNA (cytosine967-C5)-methyltransferase